MSSCVIVILSQSWFGQWPKFPMAYNEVKDANLDEISLLLGSLKKEADETLFIENDIRGV